MYDSWVVTPNLYVWVFGLVSSVSCPWRLLPPCTPTWGGRLSAILPSVEPPRGGGQTADGGGSRSVLGYPLHRVDSMPHHVNESMNREYWGPRMKCATVSY